MNCICIVGLEHDKRFVFIRFEEVFVDLGVEFLSEICALETYVEVVVAFGVFVKFEFHRFEDFVYGQQPQWNL